MLNGCIPGPLESLAGRIGVFQGIFTPYSIRLLTTDFYHFPVDIWGQVYMEVYMGQSEM